MPGRISFQQVRETLPNFPEEVINDWVLEHPRGWPLSNSGMCGASLLSKTINFWKNTEWELIEFNKINFSFSNESEDAIAAISSSFSFDFNDPKTIFTEIKEKRYVNILSCILENGTFPKPVCLLLENQQYTIADGHHRIYALGVATLIVDTLKRKGGSHTEEFRDLLLKSWGIPSFVPPSNIQKVWIAKTR